MSEKQKSGGNVDKVDQSLDQQIESIDNPQELLRLSHLILYRIGNILPLVSNRDIPEENSYEGLGQFEELIMQAIIFLKAEAYGVSIQSQLKKWTNRDYAIGAIYSVLKEIEKKKLIESHLTDAIPVRGGRGRKMYTITEMGLERLNQVTHVRRKIQEEMSRIMPK